MSNMENKVVGKRINFDYPPRRHTEDDIKYGEDIIVREQRIEEMPRAKELIQLPYSLNPNYEFVNIVGTLDIANDTVLFIHIRMNIGTDLYVISYYKRKENELVEVVGPNTTGGDFPFGFKEGDYITSAYRTDDQQRIHIAFTDGVNPPYYVNIGTRDNLQLADYQKNLNDVRLFPEERHNAELTVSIEEGGILMEGVYFVTYRYFYEDGKYGSFPGFSAPMPIIEGNRLRIDVHQDELPTFDGIEVYVMFNNEIRRVYREKLGATDFTIIYGENTGQVITSDELLLNTTVYDKIGTIGTVDNRLLVGDVKFTNYNNYNFQPLVNKMKVILTKETVSLEDSKSKRTFRPGEVYALYWQPQFISGEWGKAYILNNIGSDGTTFDRAFAYEENQHYPSTGGFPTDDQGNPLPVTNFRIPDEEEIIDGLLSGNLSQYSGEDTNKFMLSYGILFGFQLSVRNVFETDATDEVKAVWQTIKQWRLLYAKKTLGNSRIVDSGQLTYGGVGKTIRELKEGNKVSPIVEKEAGFCSTGGILSFKGDYSVQELEFPTDGTSPTYHEYDKWACEIMPYWKHIRLQSPEGLINSYKIPSGCRLKAGLASWTMNYIQHFDLDEPNKAPAKESVDYIDGEIRQSTFIDYRHVDFTKTGVISNLVPGSLPPPNPPFDTINIDDHEYLLSGASTSVNNIVGETCLLLKLQQGLQLTWKVIENDVSTFYWQVNDEGIVRSGNQVFITGVEKVIYDVPELIATGWIINEASDKHGFFWKDELIPTSAYSSTYYANTTLRQDGDAYLGYYTGFYSAPYSAKRMTNNGRLGPTNDGEAGYLLNCGIKAYRKTALYSRLNLDARSQDSIESTFKGRFEESEGSAYETLKMRDTRNSQTVQIPIGLSKLNSFEAVSIHYDDVFDNKTISFPFRLHASLELDWRNMPPLQYQDLPVEFGKIQRLEEWGDRVIIHQELGLHLSRDKVSIQTDQVSAYVGTTDFLGTVPQQIMPRSNDMGLSDKFNAIITKVGYWFIGSNSKIFLLTDGIEEVSAFGLRYLFRDNLPDDVRFILSYSDVEERLFVSVITKNKPKSVGEITDDNASSFEFGEIVEYNGKTYKIVE